VSSQRFKLESSSSSLALCNSSTEFITGSDELSTITARRLRRRRKGNFTESEPVKRKKKRLPIQFRIQARNQQTESDPKSSGRYQLESPVRTQVNA